ncbi:MAG: FeoB-associated Cys-rich membrane protein [Clostridiales bacterium]|nr:FeoB-associated Cys-rich membrane protein [Clostridiales bacterium]MDY4181986.1 FeoB-associated Cys-rich membrane protein [Pseudoflavonifractor sp.]
MKYVIYLAVAALVVWSVWYVARHIRRQLRGDCGCGCSGGCECCGTPCGKRKK